MLLDVLYPIIFDVLRVCGIVVLVVKNGDHNYRRLARYATRARLFRTRKQPYQTGDSQSK